MCCGGVKIYCSLKKKDPGELQPDPRDLVLLEAQDQNGHAKENKRRERPAVSVPWLQKTKYITGIVEDSMRTRSEKETRYLDFPLFVWYTEFIEISGKEAEESREEQIEIINNTFEAAKRAPVHPTKPNMKAVEILEVFPNFELWPNTQVLCLFSFS